MERDQRQSLVPDNHSQQVGLGPVRARRRWEDNTDDPRIDFSELWDTLRRGKWIILTTCLVVVGVMVAYTMTIAPTYEASSVVLVEPQDSQPERVALVGAGESRDIEREIGILQYSAELEQRVARQIKEQLDDGAIEQFPLVTGPEEEELSTDEIADKLSGRVSFSVLSSDALLEISATSEVPEEAALIANLYAEAYRNYARETSRENVAAARKFLEDQVAKRRAEVQQLENEWENFVRNHDVVTLGEDGDRLVEEYTGLESERDQLLFEIEQERGSLEVLRQRVSDLQESLSGQVSNEQTIASLNREIEAIDERIAELKAEAEPYYINNPELRGNEDQVPELAELQERIEGYQERKEELTQELIDETSRQSETMGEEGSLAALRELRQEIAEKEMQIQQMEEQVGRLNERIQAYEDDLEEIPRQTIERQQLERQIDQAQDFHRTVAEELRSTIIAEESELGYVKQVRSAGVPLMPVSPDYRKNILLGLLLGLGLGVGLVFIREAMNKQLNDPEDVQDIGHSLIGVIPQMDQEVKSVFDGKETVEVEGKKVSTRLFPLLEPWSPISENYRLVRTNLQHARDGRPPKVLLITSPEMAEGKTLTSVNIAITMAQSGRRTVLVDADMRQPSTHTLLDINRGPGLADFLDARTDSVEEIAVTGVKNLHIIPAGRTETPPAEALDGDRMKTLLEHLKNSYDVVIVDSPPVLAVTDPVILAPKCDATLLVVSARQTDIRAIQSTEETLEAVGVSVAGVILNRHDIDEDDRYSYGYGYGYGYAQ